MSNIDDYAPGTAAHPRPRSFQRYLRGAANLGLLNWREISWRVHPARWLRSREAESIDWPIYLLGRMLRRNLDIVPATRNSDDWAGLDELQNVFDAILLLRLIYRVVDYFSRTLWFWPLVAFATTAALTFALNPVWKELSIWVSLIAFTSAVFLGLVWITELKMVHRLLRPQSTEAEGGS